MAIEWGLTGVGGGVELSDRVEVAGLGDLWYNRGNRHATLAVNAGKTERPAMTEEQRDYLADLALAKGVRLEDTDRKSAAWASQKISELEAMPDAEFPEISEAEVQKIDLMTEWVRKELKRWTFTR